MDNRFLAPEGKGRNQRKVARIDITAIRGHEFVAACPEGGRQPVPCQRRQLVMDQMQIVVEEKKGKRIGTKVLDAGDIIETLSGWTTIGYGKSLLPLIKLPFGMKSDFRKKGTETHKGIETMDQTISELSVQCDPKDATKALYLISAPAKEINMDLIKQLGDYVRSVSPEAIIRNGDYPGERGSIDLILILSQLKDVERVRDFYTRAASIADEIKKQETATGGFSATEEAAEDIPTLF